MASRSLVGKKFSISSTKSRVILPRTFEKMEDIRTRYLIRLYTHVTLYLFVPLLINNNIVVTQDITDSRAADTTTTRLTAWKIKMSNDKRQNNASYHINATAASSSRARRKTFSTFLLFPIPPQTIQKTSIIIIILHHVL
jgi:hypothetical protein